MMEKVKEFYHLRTWKKAHLLTLSVYQATASFPDSEKYGLINQLRRAASSIEANIAEGFGRYYFKDKIRFYFNARGSLYEVQSFLLLASDLKLLSKINFDRIFEHTKVVSKLISGLIRSIEKQK